MVRLKLIQSDIAGPLLYNGVNSVEIISNLTWDNDNSVLNINGDITFNTELNSDKKYIHSTDTSLSLIVNNQNQSRLIELKLLTDSNTQSAVFTDQANSKGIEYGGNYINNFTDRSLVDKAYVDGVLSGISIPALNQKGDLLSYSTIIEKIPIGLTNQILTVDLNETTGLKWVNRDYVPNIKSAVVSNAAFVGVSGQLKTYQVVFTTPFVNTNYVINITGIDVRVFTYSNKTINGFTINTNSASLLTNEVSWLAILNI